MAWQLHCPTVVMMTNLQEGRKKCEQYWPQFGSADYGPYSVTLAEQKILADYTIRKLTLTVCDMCIYCIFAYTVEKTGHHYFFRGYNVSTTCHLGLKKKHPVYRGVFNSVPDTPELKTPL